MNFRASCKLCYLAAPVIQWSNQTSSKWLQLKEYSLVSPWLMVFGKHTITLIDPMFGDKYFIKTPRKTELVGELTMHCSRYGWLLMGQWYGPLFFFNPFTSDTRKLPEASDLVRFDFSAPPTSPDCIVVGFTSRLVLIHFVGRDPYWHPHTLDSGNDDPDLYRFPAFYGGDVCALRNGKGVDVFKDVGNLNCERERVVDEVLISSCTSKAQRYLVKCDHEYKCDQHILMLIVGEFGESVEVFIPNKHVAKWDKIDDIGRHVIYIGDKTCLCMEAKTAKMENKIYFPRLHYESLLADDTAHMDMLETKHDDLEDRAKQLCRLWDYLLTQAEELEQRHESLGQADALRTRASLLIPRAEALGRRAAALERLVAPLRRWMDALIQCSDAYESRMRFFLDIIHEHHKKKQGLETKKELTEKAAAKPEKKPEKTAEEEKVEVKAEPTTMTTKRVSVRSRSNGEKGPVIHKRQKSNNYMYYYAAGAAAVLTSEPLAVGYTLYA